ncbi:hypothetical protein SAMN05518800_1203 [Variovorax sp. YR752]|uniref:hypothetical protein n=1 Tax=Variovorax sp. YR752 TaxID=1884383 RepID=UPI000BCD3FC1|nr:hypothetical protein [Variovorax sp. YR752]SOD24063.1 hypothetical protein SAMN05518800_1203 [Variovorax sp. YR752]
MPWELERLSEKALELEFASQLNRQRGGKLLWFGLTQKQEAECEGTTSNNHFADFWRLCESFQREAFGIVQFKA